MAKGFPTSDKLLAGQIPARNVDTKSNGKSRAPSEVANIRVNIDPSKLTIGDIRFLNKATSELLDDPAAFERTMEFLDRVIVGGVDQYPMDALPAIFEAVFKQLQNQRENRAKNSRKPRQPGPG